MTVRCFPFFPPRSAQPRPYRRVLLSAPDGPRMWRAACTSNVRRHGSPSLLMCICGSLCPEFLRRGRNPQSWGRRQCGRSKSWVGKWRSRPRMPNSISARGGKSFMTNSMAGERRRRCVARPRAIVLLERRRALLPVKVRLVKKAWRWICKGRWATPGGFQCPRAKNLLFPVNAIGEKSG